MEMDASANQERPAMTSPFPLAAQIATGLSVGLLAGSIHFATLHWNVRLLIAGTAARALALQLLRLAGVAVWFALLAKLGPWALLCGVAGLLIARYVVIRRIKAAP
jgi:F1F0 ATPase subunit 2